MEMSFIAINRTVEEKAASDEEYRKELENNGKLLLSTVRQMPGRVIVKKLHSLGLDVDRADLERWCGRFMSAQNLSTSLIREHDLNLQDNEEDWIWMGLTALWERWLPTVPNCEMLDDKIQAGYHMDYADSADICEAWLTAWRDIHALMKLHCIGTLNQLDNMFAGSECIFNWMQDFTESLYQAGRHDPKYLWHRIAVCEDIQRLWRTDDQLLTENLKRDIAESYFLLGETEKAESLFKRYLEADPAWGWAWIGWSDCYYFLNTDAPDIDEAERLLKQGLGVADVRDRADLLDRLLRLYEESGRAEEAGRTRAELKRAQNTLTTEVRRTGERSMQVKHKTTFGEEGLPLDALEHLGDHAPLPAPSPSEATAKVGRNDPCPCGSGKKYKKCCM